MYTDQDGEFYKQLALPRGIYEDEAALGSCQGLLCIGKHDAIQCSEEVLVLAELNEMETYPSFQSTLKKHEKYKALFNKGYRGLSSSCIKFEESLILLDNHNAFQTHTYTNLLPIFNEVLVC
ncbi:hypothetical protein ACFE04_024939 [Oxalis oulophora]